MSTVTFRKSNLVELIFIPVFRDNPKVLVLLLQGTCRGKSLSEGLSFLRELGELSEDRLVQIVEQTHKNHLMELDLLQDYIDSYRQKLLHCLGTSMSP